MREFQNEREALEAVCSKLNLRLEELLQREPKIIYYEFPICKPLWVYEVKKNLKVGVSFTRHHRRKNLYGAYIIKGEKVERI
ncbi:MAG: hypothetical protein QW507_01395 [Candidatus Nanoarchaeia archaeon]|nr:hypothetical protein [Candidatus Haiyanarchaeum thermophilum]MCW1303180.1 hypothetical protein [Candidatus Haiyanarchaeum thermophilum]MCW1303846.1 hypothetical protein [Candidatus Haiyanarchaeum thermophilum]MCW1306538.1 hypothetical protein [Candidatus Haiyanarchaeum thermophilum]MCW1306951.1 hypothetical protein [Candidatus Haiyanarchaeum thermophilum]